MTDAIELLRCDHDEVRRLLSALERADAELADGALADGGLVDGGLVAQLAEMRLGAD
jgi:hypothetical protein